MEDLVKEFENTYGSDIRRYKLVPTRKWKLDIGDKHTIANNDGSLFDLKEPDTLKIEPNIPVEVVKRLKISVPDMIKILADEQLYDQLLQEIDLYMINQDCFNYTYIRPDESEPILSLLESENGVELRCYGIKDDIL